jgi:hypothetical protein
MDDQDYDSPITTPTCALIYLHTMVPITLLGIIIIVSDAFGMPFINNKLLADHYASQGQYLVYLPDFMDGSAAPVTMIDSLGGLMKGDSILAWLKKPSVMASPQF